MVTLSDSLWIPREAMLELGPRIKQSAVERLIGGEGMESTRDEGRGGC